MLIICLSLAALAFHVGIVESHTVITYPPWRGDNLITNGTNPSDDIHALGQNYVDGQYTFPYGQQWMYPCGGMPMSTNRSLWPVTGGAVAVQPGWFQGHKTATIYINVGINGPGDVNPPNMSHPVVPAFQITGPVNTAYPGSFCLPQVPLVPNVTFNIGDNITIQVIELAQHGAAIYNCADVTLAHPDDVPEVNATNCYNSSDLSFQLIYATANITSDSRPLAVPSSTLYLTLPLLLGLFSLVL